MHDLLDRAVVVEKVNISRALISAFQSRLRVLTIIFQALNRFTLLADTSEDVPRLTKRKYSDFNLSTEEWDLLKLVKDVLKVYFLCISLIVPAYILEKEPALTQQEFSSETEPTLWKMIPILECIKDKWTEMSVDENTSV